MEWMYYESPIGRLTVGAKQGKLCGLWIEGQKYYPSSLPLINTMNTASPVLLQAKLWLDDYFSGKEPAAENLPLLLEGTEFQQAVWRLLMAIPYGKTVTYGSLAKEIVREVGAAHMSSQAVGGAVGSNPISIIVPCHRVVGAKGQLTGYAGGIECKRWLLLHEATHT